LRQRLNESGFRCVVSGPGRVPTPRETGLFRFTIELIRTPPMIRKFLKVLIMLPAGMVLALLALANRQPVTVSFDPFDAADTDFTVTVPLWVLGFTILIAGVLLGGFAAWLKQGRHRRFGSRLAAENVMIRTELASLKGKAARPEGRALTLPVRRAS
jgi:uncharacterized integral membrane protein